jgi:SPX domain protein involved in polyphosphate accumulation
MTADHRYQRSRYELKYVIDGACARRVRDFVRGHLRRDVHAIPEMRHAYPIYSLYLDGPGLMLYNATVQAQRNRFKLRVRYYGHEPGSPVFCEIKRRVNDVIIKERAAVRRSSLARLLNGHHPRRDDLLDDERADALDALRRFCELRNSLLAEPRIIVYFEREAWVSPQDESVRVTFDYEAAAAHYADDLRPSEWCDARVPGVILELKFDDRFPVWMRDLVQSSDLHRTPMGKYVHCMDHLPRAARHFACSIGL